MKINEDWKLVEYSKGMWEFNCVWRCEIKATTKDVNGSYISNLTHCWRCNKIAPKEIITKAKLLGFK